MTDQHKVAHNLKDKAKTPTILEMYEYVQYMYCICIYEQNLNMLLKKPT